MQHNRHLMPTKQQPTQDIDSDLERAMTLADTLGQIADLVLRPSGQEDSVEPSVTVPAAHLADARDKITALVQAVQAARDHANPVKPDVALVSQLPYMAIGTPHETDKEILRMAAARIQYGIPDIEPTDEMIRTALAVQWPALYRDSLYTEHDGPRTRQRTDERVDIVKRQFKAMVKAMVQPEFARISS